MDITTKPKSKRKSRLDKAILNVGYMALIFRLVQLTAECVYRGSGNMDKAHKRELEFLFKLR